MNHTVCDRARETCPRLPGQTVTAHWGMPDPAAAEGDEAAREAVFWDVLMFLGRRIDLLWALPDEKLRGMALRASGRAIHEADETAQPRGGLT